MRRSFWLTGLLLLLLLSSAWAQRVCQSPDSLFVDSTGASRILNLFVYVPPTTNEWVLGIFDQDEDGPVGQPSSFRLYAPDGSEALVLNRPQKNAWSEYLVGVNGRWGIWRLTVIGPQPPQGQRQPVRNHFLVRTVGEVDLFAKPEPVVVARGLRFSEPRFGGEAVHRFFVPIPELPRVRFNFLRPREEQSVQIQLQAPEGVFFQQRWGGLPRGSIEFLEINGTNLQGLWQLTVTQVKGIYTLGIEQELRVFFTDQPLMPMPQKVTVTTFVPEEGTLVPARLDLSSPQTATETYVTFTDRDGSGVLFLLPGITYRVTASRGFEFTSSVAFVTAESKAFSLPLSRQLHRLPGWYCGDNHVHTVYSDGNDTPAQIVEAARGEGLDWVVLTDHGVGPLIQHVLTAHQEALLFSEPGKFVVIPGEEFTTPNYHANVLNGTVLELPTASLQQVIEAVLKADTPERPITIKLNHPHWSGTAKAPELARQLSQLPLIELWNDDNGDGGFQTTLLWWDFLGKGLKVFAETSTDSHNRKTSPLGHRRTYVYLGDAPLTAANIIQALRNGHSFLSRGALLFVTVNEALPGQTVSGSDALLKVHLQSAFPVDRLEVVHNGEVIHTIALDNQKSFTGKVRLQLKDGWVLVRVLRKGESMPLAMTNPVFVRTQN